MPRLSHFSQCPKLYTMTRNSTSCVVEVSVQVAQVFRFLLHIFLHSRQLKCVYLETRPLHVLSQDMLLEREASLLQTKSEKVGVDQVHAMSL